MRPLLALTLMLGTAMSVHATTYLYISDSGNNKILVYQLDTNDGSLAKVGELQFDSAPGSLGIDPTQKYLYGSLRTDATLASFKIDSKTGKLTFINKVELGDNQNAAFVGTDRSGKYLLSASYAAGKVFAHSLTKMGKISKALQTIETARTAHCIAQDDKNRWVFVPHVAPNAIYQFHFDAQTGKLTEAGQAPGGAKGAGPRHLAFHPSQKFAYSSDETGSSITAYRFDAKKGLSPMQTLSTLPKGYKKKNTTAEVKVHPNGKFVWVSNRGHDSLAGFAIDTKTGKLKSIGQTPTEKTPRSFNIEPDGQYVFGAGEGSGKLAVYRVDPKTGTLTRIHTYNLGKRLSWVTSVKY